MEKFIILIVKDVSFNPCFNGCRSAIVIISRDIFIHQSFNPCFNGCRSAISYQILFKTMMNGVSILVLMDVGLRLCSSPINSHSYISFQSLF